MHGFFSLKYPAIATAFLASTTSAAPAALAERNIITDILNFVLPANLSNAITLWGEPVNDYNCKSTRNPVVLLHGLSANRDIVNGLQQELSSSGFCPFSYTYGAHSLVPFVGGLEEMRDSAKDIAAFVRDVQTRTGAAKVDIVGHSEGGVMSIYVPLTQSGIADIVGHTVALGPAVHGAKYYGFTDMWYFGGQTTRDFVGEVLHVLGCPACDDMATDGAVYDDFLAAGDHIVPPDVKTTVLMSRADTLVAPNVSTIDEPGVRNIFVQDYCADDNVGHVGLIWDRNVWEIVKNELDEKYDAKIEKCNYDFIVPV